MDGSGCKSVPLHADVRSHLSGSSANQPSAASEKSWHRIFFLKMNLASLVFLSNSDLDLEHSNRIDVVRPTKLGLVSNLIAAWRKTPEVYTARN